MNGCWFRMGCLCLDDFNYGGGSKIQLYISFERIFWKIYWTEKSYGSKPDQY